MRSLLVVTLVAATLVVAGCGGGSSPRDGDNGEASKSADQVLADALKAVNSASSFRLSGTENTSSGQVGFDISVAKGKGAKGSMNFAGTPVQLIEVGTNGYLKASPSGWNKLAGPRSGPMFAHRLAGRWLRFPVNDPQFQPLLAYTSPKALLDQLQTATSALGNSGVRSYQGKRVVKLHDPVMNGTLYVAATGPPYPLVLVPSGAGLAGGGGKITFGDWGKPLRLTAPKDVLDVSRLSG